MAQVRRRRIGEAFLCHREFLQRTDARTPGQRQDNTPSYAHHPARFHSMPLLGYQQVPRAPSSMPRYWRSEVEDDARAQPLAVSITPRESGTIQSRQQPSYQDLISASWHSAPAVPSTPGSSRALKTGRVVAPRGDPPHHLSVVADPTEQSVPTRKDFTVPPPPYIDDRSVRPDKEVGSIGVGRAEPDWHRRIKLDQRAAPSKINFRGVEPSEPRFSGE